MAEGGESRVEHVLVVPAARVCELGSVHGFLPDDGTALNWLLAGGASRFVARPEAEQDTSLKQLIPYVVLRWGGQVFTYTRGGAGGETRLHARRSIGIGGHISSEDAPGSLPGIEAYRRGMLREVEEEVALGAGYREGVVGLINDDRTPVGQVHLGVVHLFDLHAPLAAPREAGLVEAGFRSLPELRADRERFETWSQFLLDWPGLAGPG